MARAGLLDLQCAAVGACRPRQVDTALRHAVRALRARPVEAARGIGGVAHGHARAARHRRLLEHLRKARYRQHAPRIGGGGAPGAAHLAADQAGGQLRRVFLPARQFGGQRQQPRGVGVAAGHHPPPVVVALGGERQPRALHRQARAQQLLCLGQPLLALRDLGDARQQQRPVEQRRGRPLRRQDLDRIQHACLRMAGA
ncbi:hypothetical protein D9M70_491040 [compost metagenome]